MTRHEFFQHRLHMIGLYDKDCDPVMRVGPAVEQLSLVLQQQGHSGLSLSYTMRVLTELMEEWENYGQVAPDAMFEDNK